MKDLLDTIDLYDNNTSDMADGGRTGYKLAGEVKDGKELHL